MTEVYAGFGKVESYDIEKDRVDHVNSLGLSSVKAINENSEKATYRLVANSQVYDVIDLDPYGFPSRYFPHVFHLIRDGLLLLHFQKWAQRRSIK